MKKLLLALALCLAPTGAWAQCNGSFPANTVCGATVQGPPHPIPPTAVGGNNGGLNLTRSQIPTSTLGTGTIILGGYRTLNDLGFGATYTTSGATSTGLMAVQAADGHWWNMVTTDHFSVGWFGAYADGLADPNNDPSPPAYEFITAGDITNNPQWRGTYVVGTTWDTVAVQESKYAAYASASTPGSIVWNGNQSSQNVEWYIPNGSYGINKQIYSVQSGFRDRGEGKSTAQLDWIGSTGTIMWVCDSCNYGQEINLSVVSNQIPSYPTLVPLVSWDWTGANSGLKTQQLTLYDMYCGVSINGQCMQISRTGSGSQGDTITFVTPSWNAFYGDYALNINGDNALSVVVVNGDCQGFQHDCIVVGGGSALTYATHFENQNLNGVAETPVLNQITTHGADVHATGGVGNADNIVHGARSEGTILTAGFAGITDVNDSSVLGGDLSGHLLSSPYLPGMIVKPSANNTKSRTFAVVDDGGPGTWPAPTNITGLVLTDSGAAYTVNQWVGFELYIRFGDSVNDLGFTQRCPIASNTATTITVTASENCTGGSLPALQTGMLYHIGGHSSGVEPNWDGATAGFSAQSEFTGDGFYTLAGSNQVGTGNEASQISVNDYIMVPLADQIAPSGASAVAMPLYGKVTVKSGSSCAAFSGITNCLTINKNAAFTLGTSAAQIGAFGYYGTPITDGDIKWIDLEFDVAQAAHIIKNFNTTAGKIGATNGRYGDISGFIYGRTDWADTTYNSGGLSSGAPPSQITANMTQGQLLNRLCGPLTNSTSVDITNFLNNCSEIPWTPTQNTSLYAPAPSTVGAQQFDLLITTSGTSAMAVQFANNFTSQGTLNTGSTNGAAFTIRFVSDGTTWREAWRAPSLVGFSANQVPYFDGTKLAPMTGVSWNNSSQVITWPGAVLSGNTAINYHSNTVTAGTTFEANGAASLDIPDTFLTRRAAAVWQFGQPDAAAPVAQSLAMQSVVAGTSNTSAPALTVQGALSTGLGGGGDIIFTTTSSQSTGTSQNTATEAMRLTGVNHNPKFRGSVTGAVTQTFTNSPCTNSATTAQWIEVEITGQTSKWYIPACH